MSISIAIGRRAAIEADESISRRVRAWLWPETGSASPIPSLDGLRAVAVLLVLMFHAWFEIPGYIQPGELPQQFPIFYGRTGVQLFFVLSGFLLFIPYARWIFGLQRQPDMTLFYKRRILRVCPAYWASLLFLMVVNPFTTPDVIDGIAHAFFLANISRDWVYSINPVFWTMSIEVQFYLLLPLLAIALRVLSRRIGTAAATVIMIFGMAGLAAGTARLEGVPAVQALTFAPIMTGQSSVWYWLAVFGSGIACSILYVYLTQVVVLGTRQMSILRTAATLTFVAGLLAAFAMAFIPGLDRLPIKTVLFGWAYTGILFGLLFGEPILRLLFESRPLRFIGLISYSFYIWHSVVMAVADWWLPVPPTIQEHVVLKLIVGLVLSVPAAYVAYQLTERPFITARTRAREVVTA
jgi:peptidoglycan/LPS O-acetylase OafA/YrhL